MSDTAYSESDPSERVNFIRCAQCGVMVDCRDLDEVMYHETGHRPRPDIPYQGSKRIVP